MALARHASFVTTKMEWNSGSDHVPVAKVAAGTPGAFVAIGSLKSP
jgi:hypothetical protein